MEEAEREYSQEEDKRIATLMMNYSTELGFNDSANLSCRERERKFSDFFKKLHRIFNRGKSIHSIRSYESFCNRFNMIVNEMRTIRASADVTKTKPNSSSLLTILEEILLKNPYLGDPRDDDIDLTDVASKTPVILVSNLADPLLSTVKKNIPSAEIKPISKPVPSSLYASKSLDSTDFKAISKPLEKNDDLDVLSLDSLDSTLSDDNLGDFKYTNLDTPQEPFPDLDPVPSFPLSIAQDKSLKKGKGESLQAADSISPFPTSSPRHGIAGGSGSSGSTGVSSLHSLGVNAPISNIAIPDPNSYPIFPSTSPFNNNPPSGYLNVSPSHAHTNFTSFNNSEVFHITEKMNEVPGRIRKRTHRGSIELPTDPANPQEIQTDDKKSLVIPEGRNSGIVMVNCSVEIKELHTHPMGEQQTLLEEVEEIQKEVEKSSFSHEQLQEIEKRLLQIVAAVNPK